MPELLVDFITSLDGYASGEGWPGFWGHEGPEYLAWLGEQARGHLPDGSEHLPADVGLRRRRAPKSQHEFTADEEASLDELTQAAKVVFSSSLDWATSTLVRDDAVEAVGS